MKATLALAALVATVALPASAQQPHMMPPPGAAPAAPMAMAPMDGATFRTMAMMSDGFEIASSRLALERSRNPRVRAFAEEMIQDHAMSSQALNGGRPVYAETGELVTGSVGGSAVGAGVGFLAGGPVGAAVGAGVGAATGSVAGAPLRAAMPLDARKSAMLNQLAAAEGPAFDRLYGQMQVMAHEEAIGMFTAYAQSGTDPALRTFAQQTLPHLEMHYGMARRLPR